MLTRCTACSTTFRVTPEQLKARLGRVRCGQCQTVFNALDSLVEEAPLVVAGVETLPDTPLPADLKEISSPVAALPEVEDPAAADFPDPPTLPHEPPPPDELPVEQVSEAGIEIEDPTPTDSFVTEHGPEPLPTGGDDEDSPALIEETSHEAFPPASRSRRWPWIVGLMFALVLLAVQAVVQYRVELAVLAPQLKPALVALCEPFACDVPLPAHADLLAIENSDLHPGDRKGRLQLVATLKNRAPFTQNYPRLELTINDVADRALIVRSLSPEEYLPITYSSPAGFAASSDLPITLDLDVGDLPAAGYRLYIYYP